MKDKIDNKVHAALKNWGIVQAKGLAQAGIPPRHPNAPSWQERAKGETTYPDEDWAEETQAAMVRCAANDMQTANILADHYRDGGDIDVEHEVSEFRRTVQRRKDMLDRILQDARDRFKAFMR